MHGGVSASLTVSVVVDPLDKQPHWLHVWWISQKEITFTYASLLLALTSRLYKTHRRRSFTNCLESSDDIWLI